MKRYSRDPYWTTAKFAGKCSRCDGPIRKGESIFYYPNTRTVLCDSDDCGTHASREFNGAKFDESVYSGMEY